MNERYLSPFASPTEHAAVSDIIRRTSTNDTDVREAVLRGLDVSSAKSVLDLGCGFGFMTEAVAGRVAPDARIVGVDACPANAAPCLDRVASTGRSGRFICQRIEGRLDWPDDSFDLVVASYALYFFVDVLPEVARVLAPHGGFLATTHTENSSRDLLRALGIPESGSRLLTLIGNFSAENGGGVLGPWFTEVERVDYRNALAFDPGHRNDFAAYVRFKLPLLWPDWETDGELPKPLARAARAAVSRQGGIVLEKNDAAFRCKGPRCR